MDGAASSQEDGPSRGWNSLNSPFGAKDAEQASNRIMTRTFTGVIHLGGDG